MLGCHGIRMSISGLALLIGLLCANDVHAGDAKTILVPRVTIYPGDQIKDDWLVERDVAENVPNSRFILAETRTEIVGKIARRTLLPGAPIPLSAITAPKMVTNGAKVKVVFAAGGLNITAYATALQSGGVGDVVTVRNIDSGVTVSGIVQTDGSISVGGG